MNFIQQAVRSNVMQGVTEVLTTVLLGLLSLASAWAVAFFNKARVKAGAEINALKNEDAQNLLRAALEQANMLAETTVQAIEQTVARDLREEIKKGHVDAGELAQLGRQAVSEIYQHLKPEYLTALDSNMTNLRTYITQLVESKVLEAKAI